jgi:hypothetical protein
MLTLFFNAATVTFSFKLGAMENSAGAPAELGSVLLDTYIDLNHTARAGSIALLSGRPGAMVARDAWEYALAVSGWGAWLYRSNPLGSPQLVGNVAVSADPKTAEVRVVVPASMLRGNPGRWGYVVASYAADPKTTSKPPPKPLADPKRGAILGLLAPLEQQMALAAEGGRPRLVAVRAKAAP